MLPSKLISIEEAVGKIPEGASIMLGGFGVPGTPFTLIQALVRHGAKDLTIIKNDANETQLGVDHLLKAGLVNKLITTHIGLNPRANEMMNAGEIEVEFVAQGILAERIRAAGAGLKGFVTDIGMHTEFAIGKEVFSLQGQDVIFEPALSADFAFIHAKKADQFGNLVYHGTAMNFNPLMAMAAQHVIVETEELVDLGALDPDFIHTIGPFVDDLCVLENLSEEYQVVKR